MSPFVVLAIGVLILALLVWALCIAAARGDRALDTDHEAAMRRRQERDARLALYVNEKEPVRRSRW